GRVDRRHRRGSRRRRAPHRGGRAVIAGIVRWCARHSLLVIAMALAAAGAGALARRGLARDALADLSEPQVALVAQWMGHAAPEVAEAVTREVTEALRGVPGATAVRASAMSGMAFVEVVFASPDDLAAGCQTIAEQL